MRVRPPAIWGRCDQEQGIAHRVDIRHDQRNPRNRLPACTSIDAAPYRRILLRQRLPYNPKRTGPVDCETGYVVENGRSLEMRFDWFFCNSSTLKQPPDSGLPRIFATRAVVTRRLQIAPGLQSKGIFVVTVIRGLPGVGEVLRGRLYQYAEPFPELLRWFPERIGEPVTTPRQQTTSVVLTVRLNKPV